MKKLEGHKFKLKKGDYLLLRRRELTTKSYIGVVRNYDGINSKSGCLLNPHIHHHLSGGIERVRDFCVFAWYKEGFLILQDLETGKYNGTLKDYVDLYKMDKKDIVEFEGRLVKLKILKSL